MSYSLNIEEAERLDLLSPLAMRFINELRQDTENLISDAVDEQTEIIREQVSFAQNLIEEIEQLAEKETVMKNFRKSLSQVIENSYFER